MLLLSLICTTAAVPPIVVVDRDNIQITQSCSINIDADYIIDTDNNGVLHITGDDIVVDFNDAVLHGATSNQMPDTFSGIGIRITGKRVTLKNAHVSGYKGGIYATKTSNLIIEDCDISGNYQQRLRSTVKAEDGADWLSPHNNDENQWLNNYGAGLYIEDSNEVTVTRVLARHGQNGIVLDRVNDSAIYDNDCSFLSGWGLALWRSSNNVISRNAFDFCIRGYSHGVYNRGQDSAGLLMFEQCSGNVITENSITHGGDGIFAYSGQEALGANPPPANANVTDENIEWYRGRGNNGNVILGNDLSYAAAHGLELTFAFNNTIAQNRMVENAICGIWGGYSKATTIVKNTFKANGDMAYGLERGGINIEHGRDNWIQANTFENNACGIHLWWDADVGLTKTPWGKINGVKSFRNVIYGNTFTKDKVAIHLRESDTTFIVANKVTDVDVELLADELSRSNIKRHLDAPELNWSLPEYEPLGETSPVGARAQLAGRKNIIMTEWGPYDWQSPLLTLIEKTADRHIYRMLGKEKIQSISLEASDADVINHELNDSTLTLTTTAKNQLIEYAIIATTESGPQRVSNTFMPMQWEVLCFSYETDPQVDVEKWRKEATTQQSVKATFPSLDLAFAMGGPSNAGIKTRDGKPQLPGNHFGTFADSSITLPAGTWLLKTTSDDGIRVWLDNKIVIDDWTWHGPTPHNYEFTLTQQRIITLHIEHFEIDGYAILSLEIERVE